MATKFIVVGLDALKAPTVLTVIPLANRQLAESWVSLHTAELSTFDSYEVREIPVVAHFPTV